MRDVSPHNYLHRCQTAGWTEHKQSCRSWSNLRKANAVAGSHNKDDRLKASTLLLIEIRKSVLAAEDPEAWTAVLEYESWLDKLLEGQDPATKLKIIGAFANGYTATKQRDKVSTTFTMFGEVAEAAGLYREQAMGFQMAADCFMEAHKFKQAAVWYERARDASTQQPGLVLMESEMCKGLGKSYLQSGRSEEAVGQYRRALALVQRIGENDAALSGYTGRRKGSRVDRPYLELAALRNLVFVLGATLLEEHLDEAETLLQRIIEGGDDAPDTCLWNHFLRGIIYGSRSNYEAAAEAFQATLEVAEENPDVWNDKNTDEALCWARAGLKINCGKGGVPSVAAVVDMVLACEHGEPGVLEWESRLEELLATTQRRHHPDLLEAFGMAHVRQGRLAEAMSLYERRVKVWETLERFKDQVSDMCNIGNFHVSLNVPATPSPTRNPKPETRNPKPDPKPEPKP